MITISLCMIVKNEEAVLARCLESVKDIIDEIIIVDTGSTDRTREIAGEYTSKVYDFEWVEDFAAARNVSFSHAQCDYCMWLDADDVILPADRAELVRIKKTLPLDTDVVMMKYHTAFDEKGIPVFTYYRERILRNHAGFFWEGAVHEVIAPHGSIVYEEAAVTHRKNGPSDPDRNLRIFEKRLAQGNQLDARQWFYYGRELYFHKRYEDAIQVLNTYLDHEEGWLENRINACQILAYCYYACQQEDKALTALLKSLEYDVPRAELCCDIGKHFFDRGQYRKAIFWYETAAGRERDDQSGGFVSPDCYGYIPYLQLCVCYDRLGLREQAQRYNELAGQCKPDCPICQSNRNYFASIQMGGPAK